jgi:hypothetical protein
VAEVTEAARVQFPNALVDGRQQIPSLLSDVRAHDPPISTLTATTDEAPSFQTIQQPRDVGIAADQLIADLSTLARKTSVAVRSVTGPEDPVTDWEP